MKLVTAFLATLLFSAADAAEKPLKVLILAGQSNMEGHAKAETFDFIGDDPATAPLLKMMRGSDGKPAVCDGVSISYLTGVVEKNFDLSGKLTAGYGSVWGQAPGELGDKIGPEFTFGLKIDAALDEPVLNHQDGVGRRSIVRFRGKHDADTCRVCTRCMLDPQQPLEPDWDPGSLRCFADRRSDNRLTKSHTPGGKIPPLAMLTFMH